ncbi:MAG: hypothetical protein QNJ72_38085 [Pleurocapsa sp. MO_226.B13]|nr:hypothetical protein [Pleurocapsa sp. MO_226.B13]
MLAIDLFPCEDGHAQERSLLSAVLKTVAPNDLWIADRNMCVLAFLLGIAQRQAAFVIREHASLPQQPRGDPASSRPERDGVSLGADHRTRTFRSTVTSASGDAALTSTDS